MQLVLNDQVHWQQSPAGDRRADPGIRCTIKALRVVTIHMPEQ